ncbi:gamma subunit aminobutyric acid receptor, partial [Mytilus galloprovincialis]
TEYNCLYIPFDYLTTTSDKRIKKGGIKKVYIKIVFLKITDIETVAENYAANVFIQARWREKKLDGNTKDKVNFSEYWSPKLVVQNLENSVLNNVWKEVTVDKNNEAYIVEKRRIKGTFKERQELHDFPFDFQIEEELEKETTQRDEIESLCETLKKKRDILSELDNEILEEIAEENMEAEIEDSD